MFALIENILQAELFNPFRGRQWGLTELITIKDIDQAIKEKKYRNKELWNLDRNYHIQRIAYFVKYGWENPIEIDKYCIVDGYHRLCAAIYRKDKTISAIYTE